MKSFATRLLRMPGFRLFASGLVSTLLGVTTVVSVSAENSGPAPLTATQVAQHMTTGFPLTGAHERTRCESCHVRGEFKNTPKICAGCHTQGARISSVTLTTSHPPTAQPCELCHNTITFAVTRFDHLGIAPGTCLTCHNGTIASGKPPNHLPTSASCDACHTTSSFSGARFDHANVTKGTCVSCHNGNSAAAQPATHIPTQFSCDTCHTTTAWRPATMNHVGIASGCANCHRSGLSFGGLAPVSPPATHIPFGNSACESCHSPAAFASFAGTPMNHGPVAGIACTTCHEAGRTFYGANPITRPTPAQDPKHPTTGDCSVCHGSTSSFNAGVTAMPANHIPTSQTCAVCHTTPGNYSVATMNHVGIASGCATCHASGLSFANVTPVGPPPTHLPTTQPCELCHSLTKFTSFSGGAMNHAGIASGCANCHASGKSFYGVTVMTPPATHVPFGGAACESCHAPGAFTNFAGTAMNHGPVAGTPCASCHETGKTFYGITIVTRPTPAQDPNHPPTGECGSCHSSTLSFKTGITAMPANHIPTSQPCALCHTTAGNYSVATMNHAGIASGCATCHATGLTFANVTPVGPPPTHVPTTQPCELCHAPTKFGNFSGGAMTHAGISSGCANCHASGKSFFGVTMMTPPATHVPFGAAACESCHAPAAFTNFAGTTMNHSPVAGTPCATCHATGKSFFGITVMTPPATHIPFAGAACESCHAAAVFTSFGGTAMNHAPVSGAACATCHETGKSFFGVTIVTRPTPAQDPLHPPTGECGSCHTSTVSFKSGINGMPSNHIPTTQPCALCHTTPGNYAVATMNHAGISNGCATCHASGLSFANVTPVGPPSTHVPTTQACETCHAPAKFNSFSGTGMNHAGISSGCANCHASGKSFYGVTVMTPPATHIPFGSSACESCHAPAVFTNFGGTKMNHGPVAGMACANCHETGKSFYGVTIVTRPTPAQDANHPPTGDCGSCHSSTVSFTTGITSMPSNHIPTSQPCALCHTTPGNYAVATMNHTGIASGCATCHAAGLSFANVTPVGPPPTHVPTTQPCEICHAPAKFTNFSGATMNHAGISSGCANCHASGKSFYGVTVTTPPATHIPFGTSACESCHAPAVFTNFGGTAMNHTPVAGMACATCHASGNSYYGVTIVTLPTTGHIPNPTSLDCKGCHTTTTSFKTWTMNHTGISSNCTSCHGGQYPGVKSKPNDHPPTNADCSQCHSTSSFNKRAPAIATKPAAATTPRRGMTPGAMLTQANPAVPAAGGNATAPLRASIHANVMPGSCASCHNGRSAPTRPAKHLATTLSCDACHRTTTWIPANFTHTGATAGTCMTCHNGTGATGKAGNHFLTMRSCDTCHRVTSWRPLNPYRHLSPLYPNHTALIACDACHIAKSETVTWRYPNLKPACGACHGPDFTGGPHLRQPQNPQIPRSGSAPRVP